MTPPLFDPALVCPACGEISLNRYLAVLNHFVGPDGKCGKQRYLERKQKWKTKKD